jgi:subtilase family serine protease
MKISQRLLTYGCALAVVCLLVTGGLAGQSASPVANRVTQAPDGKTRVTLPGNVHPLARAENSRGAVEDSLAMPRILLLLKRSDQQEAALQSLMEAQQDKSSPNYHAWLTPDQFGKQFGPSEPDLQALTDWLTAQGFQNVRVAAGRTVIEFSGSAGQVQNAFGTQIQNYAVNGTLYVANSTDPQIPAALAPAVAGVVSLHNFPKKSHARFLGDARMNATSHKLQPLFTFPDPGGNGNFYGVGPGDFATIYNTRPLIASGNDGTGQTIAIVGETQINPQDVSDFRTMFGLTNNFSAANIILNGMDPGITSQDEESESDLDVQWSGAVAPGATVKFVVSAGTSASSGIDLSALYIVEHNLADVLSESYGACESDLGSAGNAFFKGLWEQAAAQGITVVVSSGDGGSAGCDDFNTETVATRGLAVSGIAGTPFNVSVGGTDFNQFNSQTTYWNTTNDTVTGTSAKGYIPEFPWNENCSQLGLTGCGATAPQGSVNIVAGSGGASSVYAKPKWQMGVAGIPNDNHRDQPDVSLFASPGFEASGYLFCQTDLTGVSSCNLNEAEYTFHIIGGTSASAPAFAGMMALVNQYAAAHGGSSRQGNANNILYALAKKSGSSCTSSVAEAAGCVFNDVAAPNIHHPSGAASNSVACKGGTLNCSATVASGTGVLVDPAHTTTEAWTAGAGYDLATGLGSLNANNLAVAWGTASTIGTTTTLSLSPTTGITHGQNENVTVTVNVKASTGTGIPAGDVALLATLADGSTLGIDQFTLSNGAIASSKTQNLPGGTYKVYAHYTGDGTNAPSDSPSVQVTVGKEASQTFIVIPTFDSQGNQTSGNATSVQYGSNYIIRMYVANNAAVASTTGAPTSPCYTVNEITCPTGSVALTASGLAIDGGSFTLNNQGYTRDIAPTLSGGTYPLVAKYAGDASYTASTSATDTFTVAPAPSTTNFNSSNFYTLVGQSLGIAVFAQVNVPGGVAPTGTFTFFDNGAPAVGTVSVSPGVSGGSIQAGIGAVLNTVGKHSITATYSGDANYASSTTSSPMVVYGQYPISVAITSDSNSVVYGKSVKITVTVTASHTIPVFTGSITLYNPFGGTIGPVTTGTSIDASGNQTLKATTVYTPQQSGYLQAFYSGDTNYQDNSNTVNISVLVPDFALSPISGVNVIPVAGQTASGQITVTPQSATPSVVTLSLSPITISGYTISLTPPQVSLNGSAASATLSMTPTVTVPANAIKAQARRAILFALPRQDWWGLSLAAGLCALLMLVGPGRAKSSRLSFGASALCLVSFALGCGGGGGGGIVTPPTGGGSSPPVPTTISLTTSNAKVAAGAPLLVTATVTSTKALTGTITFYNFGTPVSGAPIANGQAQTGQGYINNPGIYQITATYSGDAANQASTSAPLIQVLTGTFPVTIQGATGGDLHFIQGTVGVQ